MKCYEWHWPFHNGLERPWSSTNIVILYQFLMKGSGNMSSDGRARQRLNAWIFLGRIKKLNKISFWDIAGKRFRIHVQYLHVVSRDLHKHMFYSLAPEITLKEIVKILVLNYWWKTRMCSQVGIIWQRFASKVADLDTGICELHVINNLFRRKICWRSAKFNIPWAMNYWTAAC